MWQRNLHLSVVPDWNWVFCVPKAQRKVLPQMLQLFSNKFTWLCLCSRLSYMGLFVRGKCRGQPFLSHHWRKSHSAIMATFSVFFQRNHIRCTQLESINLSGMWWNVIVELCTSHVKVHTSTSFFDLIQWQVCLKIRYHSKSVVYLGVSYFPRLNWPSILSRHQIHTWFLSSC